MLGFMALTQDTCFGVGSFPLFGPTCQLALVFVTNKGLCEGHRNCHSSFPCGSRYSFYLLCVMLLQIVFFMKFLDHNSRISLIKVE